MRIAELNPETRVSAFKVMGYDLEIVDQNGKKIILKDGLSDYLTNDVELLGVNNKPITRQNIVDAISAENLGLDTVYFADIINSESITIDNNYSQQEKPISDDDLVALQNKLAALQLELDKLEEKEKEHAAKLKDSEAEAVAHQQQENESLINQVKALEQIAQQRQRVKNENKYNSTEKTEQTVTSSTPKPNASSSSSSSQSSSEPSIPPAIIPPIIDSMPVIFIQGGLDELSDSGTSGDNITNVALPTFSGTATVGSQVELVISGRTYVINTDSQGSWSITLDSMLSDGKHDYTLTVSVGAESKSVTGNVVIDTEISNTTVSLDDDSDSGQKGDNITNKSHPVFTGQAEAGATIVITLDGKKYQAIANADGVWSIKVNTTLKDGEYNYKITSTDLAGNTSSSNGNLTIDSRGPQLSYSLDDSTDSGQKGDSLTNNAYPIVSGWTEPGSVLSIVFAGKIYDVTVEADGRWEFSIPGPLSDGEYFYSVSSSDIAGNTSSSTGSFHVDTSPLTLTVELHHDHDSGIVNDNKTNSLEPAFVGVSRPHATITFMINGMSYSTTADADGHWSLSITPALPEGSVNYTVVAEDKLGNQITSSGSVIIDVSAPLTSVSFDSDTGIAGDQITNISTPSISGKSEPGAQIRITLNNNIYDIIADTNGFWAFTFDTLADGVYNYDVVAIDDAGNHSDLISDSFTIDTVQPQTSIELDRASDSGAQSDFITNHNQPVLTGQATKPGVSLAILINGITYNVVADQTGQWSLSLNQPLPDGEHNYLITVTDTAGNTNSYPGSLIIDTILPSTVPILDENSDTGLDSSDNITNDIAPTIIGVTEPGATVNLVIHGITFTSVADADGLWSITIDTTAIGLSDGVHSYTVTITDLAGNISDPINGAFTLDTESPTLTDVVLEKEDGSTSTDLTISNINTPIFAGKSEPGAKVTLTIDGQLYEVLAGADGQWKLPVTEPLIDGVHSYSITVTDIAGNIITNASVGSITINTSIPTLSAGLDTSADSGESDSDGITNINTPVFKGISVPGLTVHLLIGGLSYSTIVGATGEWQIDIPSPLLDGDYNYTITVTNAVGTSSTIDGSITIDTAISNNQVALDKTTDSGDSDRDGITNVNQPILQGKAEPGASVTLTFDGVNYKISTNSDGEWSFTLPILSDGSYSYSVTVIDKAGNLDTTTNTLVIDTQTSVTAQLDISSESTGPNITATNRPLLSGKGEAGATITVTINGKSYFANVDSDGNWTCRISDPLPQGQHNYQVDITDVAGNSSSTSGSLTYAPDGTMPPLLRGGLDENSDSNIKGDNITNINTPVFSGITDPGSDLIITIGGNTYNITVGSDGSYSFTIPDALAEGQNTYIITSTNPDTGLSTTLNGSVMVDTIAPSLEVDLSAATDSGVKSDFITQSRNPTLEGKVEAGATQLMLTIAGTNYIIPVTANGSWSFSLPANLLPANGNTPFTLTVTDLAGNSTTVTHSIITDNTKPNAPSLPTFDISDTNIGTNGNRWTNDNTPTITAGNGIAGDTVELKLTINGKITTLTTIINADGTWSITLPAGVLPANSNLLTFTAAVTYIDSAGNRSNTSSQTLSFGNQTVTVTAQLSDASDTDTKGDNITSHSRPTITGQIIGSSGNLSNVAGSIIFNGVEYPLTINTNTGIWSFTPPGPLTPGHYDYTINVIDRHGNTATIENTVTISNIVVQLSPDSDSGEFGDMVTNNASPTLNGQSTPGAIVRVLFNNIYYDITPDAAGVWQFIPPGPLTDGEHTFTVIENMNGNVMTQDAILTIDTTPPDLTTTGLANIPTTPGADATYSKTRHFTLTGKGEPGSEVTVVLGGLTYTGQVDGNGNWNIPISVSHDGEYSYTVSNNDRAGNSSSFDGTVNVDSSISAFVIHSQDGSTNSVNTNAAILVSSKTPTFTGKGEPGAIIEIRNGSKSIRSTVDEDGNWSMSIPASWWSSVNLTDGGYATTSFQIWDKAGNSTTYQLRVTMDFTPPTVNGTLIAADDDAQAGMTNSASPTFSGITDAHATVIFTINNVNYTIKANAQGAWSFIVPDSLPDGTYSYSFVAIDVAQNTSAPVSGSVIINTDPVAITGGLDLNDDSGTVGDAITNITDQTLSGTATPGMRVRLTFNGQQQEIIAGDDGLWEFNLSNLADGDYAYTVVVISPSGMKQELTGNFTIDTQPPTVTCELHASSDTGTIGDGITKVSNPIFNGITEAGAHVALVIHGVTYTTTANAQGYWSIQIDSLPAGQYNYSVSVTDRAGNVINTPLMGNVEIVTSFAPDGLSAELDSASDSGDRDNLTNINRPTLSGVAPAGIEVIVTIDGHTYSTFADATGLWSLTVGHVLSDGVIDYSVALKDSAGHLSTSISGQFEVDTKAQIALDGLQDDSDSGQKGDQLTNNSTPTLIGTAEPGSSIMLVINGVTYTTQTRADGSWFIDVTAPLGDGIHSYNVTTTDLAGNTKIVSGHIGVDTQAPDQLTVALDANSAAPGDSDVSIVRTPTFSGTTEPNATVVLTINGKSYTVTATAVGVWSITLPADAALDYGFHDYEVTVTDRAGNMSELTGQIYVDTAPLLSCGLSGASDSGTIGDNITNITTPTLTGVTNNLASVVVIVNGQAYPVIVNSNGIWSFTLPTTLADDTYSYQVIATSPFGNNTIFNGQFTIDTTPPGSITGGVHEDSDSGNLGDNITNIRTPTLAGEGEPNSTVHLQLLRADGSMIIDLNVKVDSNGFWSYTIPVGLTLPDGSYTILMTPIDAAGNIGIQVDTVFTVDTQLNITGGLSIGSDSGIVGDSVTSNTTPTFSGQSKVGSTVTLLINGASYSTTVDAAGQWSITIPNDAVLLEGTYEYVISVEDVAGNKQKLEGEVIIDTTTALTGTLDTNSDSGVSHHDGITNVNTPLFVGTGEPGSTITLSISGLTYTTTVNNDGSWECQVTNPLSDDDHSYKIETIDPAGNKDELFGSIQIDTLAPDVTLDSGTANSNIVTFEGTVDDPDAIIYFTLNGVKYNTTISGNTWHVDIDAMEIQSGNNQFEVKAIDASGNVTTNSGEFEHTPSAISVAHADTSMEIPSIDFSGASEDSEYY